MQPQPTVHVFPVQRATGPFYIAKWRHRGQQVKRSIGPAWIERGDETQAPRRRTRHPGWIKRTGRVADGYLTEDQALARVPEILAAWQAEREALKAAAAGPGPTFDDAAEAWLEHLQTVKNVKPTTLRNYRAALRRPDDQPRPRGSKPVARIMGQFGGRPLDSITTVEISRWLRGLDRERALGPRSVNQHRQIVSQIFKHACRPDAFNLTANPAAATDSAARTTQRRSSRTTRPRSSPLRARCRPALTALRIAAPPYPTMSWLRVVRRMSRMPPS